MNTIKRFFAWLYRLFTRPAARIGMGVLVTVSFIAGALFWHYFNVGMEVTNEESFCISCHTMGDNLLPELQKTVHWQNRSGVRARCPDCHVPHEFTDKVARKMQASREVWAHMVGTIGTREKFREHRIVLAQREWERMQANNSKECRNCHDYNSMDFEKMRVTSQMAMRRAAERDTSCIDCHKGIAHQMPEVKGMRNPAFDTLITEARSESVKAGSVYYSVVPQELYADAQLTQPIGSLEVATAVKVLQVSGDAQLVELDMWRKNKGFARVLYNDFGLNITSAILQRDVAGDAERVKVHDARVDDLTGLEWQKVTTQAWIREGVLLPSTEEIWNIARASYNTACSVCHRQPTESGHDANQWPGLFAGMVGFTNMDDDTANLVLKYLQLHSSDFIRNPTGGGSPENTPQTARP